MSVKGDVELDFTYLGASFLSCGLDLMPKLWEAQCSQQQGRATMRILFFSDVSWTALLASSQQGGNEKTSSETALTTDL